MIPVQQHPGCSDCEPLGPDLSVCTGKCAPKDATQKVHAPAKLWLSAPDIDHEHDVWFDPDEGGTEYVRADLYDRLQRENAELREALERILNAAGCGVDLYNDEPGKAAIKAARAALRRPA